MLAAMCDACGEPAVYLWQGRRGWKEHLCEECARFRGARERGEAEAALDTLGFAISQAQGVGVTDEQIREAFEAILTGCASSIGSYPCGGGDFVLGPDARKARPWQWAGSWARLLGTQA